MFPDFTKIILFLLYRWIVCSILCWSSFADLICISCHPQHYAEQMPTNSSKCTEELELAAQTTPLTQPV